MDFLLYNREFSIKTKAKSNQTLRNEGDIERTMTEPVPGSEIKELELSTEWLGAQESSAELEMPRVLRPQYDRFFEEYLRANRPCIVAAASTGWPCAEHWVRNNRIHYDYLTAQYGDLSVPLTDCNDFGSKPIQSTVRAYMAYLSGEDGTRTPDSRLYLKDWHLRRARPADYIYRVPGVFASDWLNEYSLDKGIDDFMFVYVGPAGSWTPLHADVYSSFSWSVNIVGRKRWLILPPGEEIKLQDRFGKLPTDFRPAEGLRCLDVVQEVGDAIFVPSGWHHVVYNELDTLSINHNWVNGCNIQNVWDSLKNALKLVEKEIEHLKDDEMFLADCQTMLRSDHGIDYNQFVDFISHIGGKRLRQQRGEMAACYGGYLLGRRHLSFDLRSLHHVAGAMLANQHLLEIVEQTKITELADLKNDIETEIE